MALFEEAEHPRAPKGSPGGGQFTEKGGAVEQPAARAFVSPNVGNLTFEQAQSGLNSQRQKLLTKVSDDIDGRLGLEGEHQDVIGAWTDGAENSLMISMTGVTRDEMLASAAMKGWLADQKSVLVFEPDARGKHFMAKFAMAGQIDYIHRQLLEDGLSNHTLEPSAEGATVHVFGRSQEELDAVDAAAGKHGTKAEIIIGNGEFVGTGKEDGTDREQRDDAKRVYEQAISEVATRGQLRGRDVARVWQDVRARWGGEFSQGEVEPIATGIDKRGVAPEQKAQLLYEEFDKAPVNEGIEAAEENWRGGVANFGDRQAAIDIQAMDGYFDYRSHLEEAATKILGDKFTVYRYMTQSSLDDWKNGADMDPMATTLSRKVADSWKKFAKFADADKEKRVVVSIPATPQDIIMRGSAEEAELVIDANNISADTVVVDGIRPKLMAKSAEAMTAEELHAGNYRRKAEEAADDVGYDKDKIVISHEIKMFKLGNDEFPYAGAADLDTGEVIVYDRVADLDNVPAIVAHETMHQKYTAYRRDLERETDTMQRELQLMPTGPTDPMIADGTLRFGWQNKYPIYQRHAEIERDLPWAEEQSKAGEFTEYAKEWWQAWRDGTAKTTEATGETLAEMATLKMMGGSLSGPPPTSKGRQYWVRLYNAVEDNWRSRHAKQRMAA